ncbi:MAG: preprotein translocase subunit SecE [Syntrophobacteraceae bacterium]
MKLFQKKDESSSKKVQNIDTARKAAAKTAKPKKSDTPKKGVKKPGETTVSWIDTTRQYLREVVYELRKVVWPSRKETLGSTAVVLVIVALSSSFLGVIDFILSRLVRIIVG